MKKNAYALIFDVDKISGEGADWLVEQVISSNYFLVGERHGTADIPELCGAVYAELANVGYNHTAL